ncbi:hypothetical protein MJD09_18600 [bacterium]|nr:hypothetical protein [bacterium]
MSRSHSNFSKTSIFLCLIWCSTESTHGAELTGIHTVSGRFYSQIVVKSDTPIQHDFLENLQDGTIKLLLSPVQSTSEIGEIRVFPYDRFVENITSELNDEKVELTIFLKTQEVQTEIRTRDWPFELLLEIRSLDNEPLVVANSERPSTQVSVSDSITPERAQTGSVGQPDSVVTAALDSTDKSTETLGFKVGPNFSAFTLDLSSNSLPQGSQARAVVRSASDSKMQTFIKVVTGFIIFDILLAGIYVSRRRRRNKLRSPDSKPPTPEIMQPVVRNQEFMDVLAASLKERSLIGESSSPTELAANPSGVEAEAKVDHLIESLSTALRGVTPLEESDVAIDPFMHQLESLSYSSGLTVEDIIGRDGQEFVKNLKRLQNK